jgi:cystathionine beta-lyase
MDFEAPDEVIDALKKAASHGVFGYSEPYDEYFDILKKRLKSLYGWDIEPRSVVNTPGVIFAIALAVKAYTERGGAVIIQQPVYYTFREVIEANDRVIVNNPLVLGGDGVYNIDFDDFEEKIKSSGAKLFILCNPHNPVGRVFSREELVRLGDICLKHGVIIVSDEIHSDFVYAGFKHIPLSALSRQFEENTVTCTAPSKTFNTTGLQFGDIIIPNDGLRKKFKLELDRAGYSQLNTFGIIAARAAYKYGGPWLERLIAYLEDNARFMDEYIRSNIPSVGFVRPQGTYLAWLDMRKLGLPQSELNGLMLQKAGLWLDSGTMFGGDEGRGFQRMNFACPRKTLEKALDALAAAVNSL